MAVQGKAWAAAMSVLHLVAGLIALALLVYLFVALLKPEEFE